MSLLRFSGRGELWKQKKKWKKEITFAKNIFGSALNNVWESQSNAQAVTTETSPGCLSN